MSAAWTPASQELLRVAPVLLAAVVRFRQFRVGLE